jgi:hypothetical protein
MDKINGLKVDGFIPKIFCLSTYQDFFNFICDRIASNFNIVISEFESVFISNH